jgi:hypothetical protein
MKFIGLIESHSITMPRHEEFGPEDDEHVSVLFQLSMSVFWRREAEGLEIGSSSGQF